MLEVIAKGGIIMIPLAIVAFIMWYLIIERMLFFKSEHSLLDYKMRQVFDEFSANSSMLAARLDQIYQEKVSSYQRHLDFIATLVAIAPLLGLLGTIFGMIATFNVIATHGTGDIHALSKGISQALISTQAGLIIALPGLFMHHRLQNKRDRLQRHLQRLFVQGKRWCR